MFGNKKDSLVMSGSGRALDFAYLDSSAVYMDTACQSPRPQGTIDVLAEYYREYNACGGRVKYAWGQKVDQIIAETRAQVLGLLGLSERHHSVSFTLNTTYGLNLLLGQLPKGIYKRVITSDIEHNSVFLPTIPLAERLGVERVVIDRLDDGTLDYSGPQLEGAIVVVNAVSNIDGRKLVNLKELVKDTHKRGGIVIIDAAQTMAHSHELLMGCEADAICFSAHKMYSASLGVVVTRNTLLEQLSMTFVGGGMVSAVRQNDFDLMRDEPYSLLEPGLQAFGEIIALHQTLDWLRTVKLAGKSRQVYMEELSTQLYEGLSSTPGVQLLNSEPSPVISLYTERMDAHRLAVFLSAAGIMVRSGYFCCHYYLLEKKGLPPLVRFSLGLHNTQHDVAYALQAVQKLISKG